MNNSKLNKLEYFFYSQNGSVYFIQSGDSGPVKIGFSSNPYFRLKQLQTGNHETLYLRKIIKGFGFFEENQLHKMLEEYNIYNEWYRPEVLKIIPFFENIFIETSNKIKDTQFVVSLFYNRFIENDNRRIEACYNIIKVCKNIAIELQAKDGKI